LIPEFYSLPEFLLNANAFEFGEPERGSRVHHVVLPPWANGDPLEFVRLMRAALESRHVSERLHHWVDLVFGCKQRGKAAVKAQNVFVHVTYENEVSQSLSLELRLVVKQQQQQQQRDFKQKRKETEVARVWAFT